MPNTSTKIVAFARNAIKIAIEEIMTEYDMKQQIMGIDALIERLNDAKKELTTTGEDHAR